MNRSELLHNALIGFTALAMVAALVFLYDRTQAVDLREQNETLASLRELKDIDNRWDVDVLRSRFELGTGAAPEINRGAAAEKALQRLAADAARSASRALNAGLPELAKAVREKAGLVDKYKAENTGVKADLNGVLRNAAELRAGAAELKSRPPALDPVLGRVLAAASEDDWLPPEAQQKTLDSALSELRIAAAALPDGLRSHAEQAYDAGQQLLKRRLAEHEAYMKLAYLTSGPRLENLTFSFNHELEATLEDKERFRVYLIYYAGALLILLAYLGFQLKAANVSLEHRVRERTRELSEALQHLKESEAQLIQSEKMSSLGQMVAGVAHEINTPLAYVKNSLGTVADKLPDLETAIEESARLLDLLQSGGNADPQLLSRQFALVSSHIAHLKQQGVVKELNGLLKDGLYGAGQMSEIVGNLKDFSRLDRSKVTSFDLNDGLNSTLSLARHMLKGVSVDKRFGQIPAVVCSPSQINQVFLNLITNAVQALPAGQGTVTLTTRADGAGVAVEVADNGKGMPAEVLPKIFDPFFSTKEIGKGTGLGLSISYKIVAQHGGRIAVDSEAGSGTRFTVWLPLKPPAEVELTA